MSGGFNNPIIGGGGGLVYPSIHSPNFQHNATGWSVNKDGSAEFNNVIVRGTITAGHFIGTGTGLEVVIYSGIPAAGNLLASMVSSQTVDTFGNSILEGLAVYGHVGNPLTAARIQETGISYYTAATQAGPWTVQASINYITATPALSISAALLTIFSTVKIGGGLLFLAPSGDVTGATDTAAIQDAITNGLEIHFLGAYYINAALNPSVAHGMRLIGPGKQNGSITWAGANNGQMFNLDPVGTSGSVHLEDMLITGLTLHAPVAPSADIFWGSNMVRSRFVHNQLQQDDAGHAIMNVSSATGSNGTGYMAECEFANTEIVGGSPRTIEAWHLDQQLTTMRCNDNTWHCRGHKIFSSNGGDTSQYWMTLIGNPSGGRGSRGNKWEDMIFELANGTGGLLHLQNSSQAKIDGFSSEDLAATGVGNPLILLDTIAADTNGTSHVMIRNYSRRGGNNVSAANPDIKLDPTCTQITIDAPGQDSGGKSLVVDLQTARNVFLAGAWPETFTLLNPGTLNVPPVTPNAGVVTPAVPATGVTINNATGRDVNVTLLGGTVTSVTVNGSVVSAVAASPMDIYLPAAQTIKLVYTVAPTWIWS